MKTVILGGGFAGLAAAWDLAGKNMDVVLIEKEKELGGLAGGFREPGWDWSLERAYHHVFDNDTDILRLAKDTGFDGFFFGSPKTTSLYDLGGNNYRTFPVDTPQDFLRFPLLSLPQKFRAGAVVAFLKLTPFLPLFREQTAERFLRTTMGDGVWEVMWQELFRKKFGKNAGNILASFIWARVKKRSKNLGYVRGGFQEFVNHLARVDVERGVELLTGTTVTGLAKKGKTIEVSLAGGKTIAAEAVISTLPTPVLLKVGRGLLPAPYETRLSRLKYMHAVNLILETDRPAMGDAYWLSVCDPKAPMMVVVQHTNLINPKHYGNRHITYIANYVDADSPLLKMTDKEVYSHYVPYLLRLAGGNLHISRSRVFRAGFAQPLFDREFPQNKPDLVTPVSNFFIANLDMTYPYDRGTNYAVKVGREAAALVKS